MKLVLIRHAESTNNSSGTYYEPNAPLSTFGVEQARYTAQFLAAESLGDIITSTLDRARCTAEEIGRGQPKSTVVSLPDFNEKDEHVRGLRRPETIDAFVVRVERAKREIIDPWNVDTTIVGHSVFLSVLTCLLLNEPLQTPLCYRNENCSITRFERINGKWIMQCQGDVSHLPSYLRTGV